MLQHLHIENIAVIETADIQFQPGFNVLTGETGAANPSSSIRCWPFWAAGQAVI